MIPLFKLVIDIVLAILLSGIIGYERQVKRGIYFAGIRTHILICLGAMIMTIVSLYGFPNDPARIVAAVVTAVGFIAAGSIIASRGEVKGLTTGIGLFVVAGVGMLIALEYYLTSVVLTAFLWVILELWQVEVKLGYKKK
jgi:putative Mg2+ transporter-C (MgtC) family protein